jgi:S1-C subfamily serine protease
MCRLLHSSTRAAFGVRVMTVLLLSVPLGFLNGCASSHAYRYIWDVGTTKQTLLALATGMDDALKERADEDSMCVGLYFNRDFYVTAVPAWNALSGIQVGDRIISVNGDGISQSGGYANFERDADPEKRHVSSVERDGALLEFEFRCEAIRPDLVYISRTAEAIREEKWKDCYVNAGLAFSRFAQSSFRLIDAFCRDLAKSGKDQLEADFILLRYVSSRNIRSLEAVFDERRDFDTHAEEIRAVADSFRRRTKRPDLAESLLAGISHARSVRQQILVSKTRRVMGVASSEDLDIEQLLRSVVVVETPMSIGSGFYFRPDLIFTNAHVVGSEPTVRIRNRDGTSAHATVIVKREHPDVAILKTTLASEDVLLLGSEESSSVGQPLLAVGTPRGLDWTVSRGILSAYRLVGGVNFVQTDAPINQGNSGGPLVDLSTGSVIGMNTLAIDKTVGEGIAFAVGASVLMELAAER